MVQNLAQSLGCSFWRQHLSSAGTDGHLETRQAVCSLFPIYNVKRNITALIVSYKSLTTKYTPEVQPTA